jgi:hypothetical protein
MNSVFLAWQDPYTKSWHLVGELTYNQGLYQFAYTKGTQTSKQFMPFERMREVNKMYFSRELFPLFANRLLNKSRPEYSNFLRWLNLDPTIPHDPLLLLARSGGVRMTDLLRVFALPEIITPEGLYEVYFFSQGLRVLWMTEIPSQFDQLSGERLRWVHDNHFSFVLEQDETMKVGEMPGYLAKVFRRVLDDPQKPVTTTVVRVNSEAPWQLKVLCKLTFQPKEMVQLFKEEELQVISTGPTKP